MVKKHADGVIPKWLHWMKAFRVPLMRNQSKNKNMPSNHPIHAVGILKKSASDLAKRNFEVSD